MECPRLCGADRSKGVSACGAPALPHIARAALHRWEEPCISGTQGFGSGAIFFCGCNLRCVFCQNIEISRGSVGAQMDEAALAALMLRLQQAGAHNINLVTPTPHTAVLIPALERAKREGLHIPVVYNTNAYERVETLARLEGLVDVYLPDFKYRTDAVAEKYSAAPRYFQIAAAAIREMLRQCGHLQLDGRGLAQRGVLIRHLVLPGSVDETRRVLDYIAAEYSTDTFLSLMRQYVPVGDAKNMPPLDRKLLPREYRRAVEYCASLGFNNVFIQGADSAEARYTPRFDGVTV